MPNYDDLRAFFDEQSGLRELASNVSEVPIVTGITLNVDPLWALIHDIGTGMVHRATSGWINDYEYDPIFSVMYPHRFWTYSPPINLLSERYQGYRRRDLTYTDERWERIKDRAESILNYELLPVVMTVVHRPIRSPTYQASTESDTDDQTHLRNLFEILNAASFFVRVEERPVAQFAFAAGDEIVASSGKSGTLGGILHDIGGGQEYGITCAHVAVNNDQVKDSSGSVLGNCVADTGRVPLPGNANCDPIILAMPNPYPGNGPEVNMLDCSLVDLTQAVSSPQVGGIASALSPGQNVVLKGAKNKLSCYLGSLTISYGFVEKSSRYCFRDAIELIPQPRLPLGGALGQITAGLPTQGDSGAWILTDDAVPSWAGLFFGEDGRRGFAIRASWVHDWAERAIGASLTV